MCDKCCDEIKPEKNFLFQSFYDDRARRQNKYRDEIKAEHLVKNSEGKVEFPKSDLKHITGHSRHLYYCKDVTVK